jgi:aminomethyltransferase
LASAAIPRSGLQKTALNPVHRKLGARMVPFAGWDMPVEYAGIVAEHMAVRTRAGLFDVSHMGRFEVAGRGALELLQSLTPNDVARLQPGQAHYSALLNARAGMIDDLVVHKIADDRYLLCVNAGRRSVDWEWISSQNYGRAELVNISDETSQLAVQGPRSVAILQRLTQVDLAAIRYYWFTRGDVAGVSCWIARTGYTGEDGFELYLPASASESIWQRLLETGTAEGLLPCGLGARNTLRLEAAMLLYGHDMDDHTTPLEVNLGWICKLDKGAFIGREVLLRQKQEGVSRKLAGLRMIDRAIARDDAPVLRQGQPAGRVTSGSYAPFLKQNIALALLPREAAQVGERVSVEIRGNLAAAEVVPLPFYRRPKS